MLVFTRARCAAPLAVVLVAAAHAAADPIRWTYLGSTVPLAGGGEY
jgi:hypothetical protein